MPSATRVARRLNCLAVNDLRAAGVTNVSGIHQRRMAERVGFEPTCRLPDKSLSRRSRYDHFGTSPRPSVYQPKPGGSRDQGFKVRRFEGSKVPRFEGSKVPPSKVRRFDHGSDVRAGRAGAEVRWRGRESYRRARKNRCIRSPHSRARTPEITSRRWFSAGCSWARRVDSMAPARGSVAP